MKTYHKCLVTITESGNSLIIKSEPSLVIPDEKGFYLWDGDFFDDND